MNISGTFYSIRRGGIIAATAATLILAGCGGGGGDGDGGSTTEPAPATDTPPPAGTANAAPTISGTAVTQVNVGTAYAMTPTAADADGDTLAFSVENLPAWATFSTATGQLTGTPTAVGTFANVAVSVSDGKASARMPAFSITVAAAGSPAPTDPPAVSPPSTGTPIVSKGAATLQWTIPTETVDKSALQDLAGYRVHYGKSGSALTNAVEVPNASVSTFVVDNLPPGTWYFAIRAVNSAGGPSALSNVLRVDVT